MAVHTNIQLHCSGQETNAAAAVPVVVTAVARYSCCDNVLVLVLRYRFLAPKHRLVLDCMKVNVDAMLC